MAQPATNSKIDELRLKLKTDPKSRLFYQLAEELRKAGHCDEAEQVLRNGLEVYPTYLAAWVSLGRTARDQKNDPVAVEALNKALQLDPGNVVAARLLGDAYLALGQKVEAIKKYKLVHALLPADEELRNTIDQLDHDIRASEPEAVPEPEPQAEPDEPPVSEPEPEPEPISEPEPDPLPFETAPEPAAEPAVAALEESPFDRTTPPFDEAARVLGEEIRMEQETGDVEPMSLAHDDSPFESPVETYTAAALQIEAPLGMSIASAPLVAEVPSPVFEEEPLPDVDAAPVFDTPGALPAVQSDDIVNTLTMADLYVRQGLHEDARHIYENILARHPENTEVRAKLEAIAPRANPKVAVLEKWLAKVTRREVGRV